MKVFSFMKLSVFLTIAIFLSVAIVPQPVSAQSSVSKMYVYRFYHYKTSSHFYTTSQSEQERVITTMPDKYRYEGAKFAGWVGSGYSRVPVARFYNLKTSTHFYTMSSSEISRLISSSQFRYEGTAYYGQNNYANNDDYGYDWEGQCSLYRFYNFTNGTHFYTANIFEADNVASNMSHKYRYEGVAYIVWTENCYE